MKKGLPPAPSAPRRGSATPVPALAPDVDSEEEDAVYVWVDGFNFSRPKKNIIRDFSDGVLMAELLHSLYPKLVELHNYTPSHSIEHKATNWKTLNQRVLRRLGFCLSDEDITNVSKGVQGAIQRVLYLTRTKAKLYEARQAEARFRTKEQKLKEEEEAALRRCRRPTGSRLVPAGCCECGESDKCGDTCCTGTGSSTAGEELLHSLRETVEVLNKKSCKLETLIKVKDSRMEKLSSRMRKLEIAAKSHGLSLMSDDEEEE